MQNGTESGAIVAVGEARTALPSALETQTKAIGVIVPPPDIRAICDKTAQFVARNGAEFEKRILANEATNQKFNFLKEGDPYNAYYRKQVADFAAAEKGEGGEGAAAAPQQAAPAPAPTPAPAPEKKAALPPTKPLEAPAEEQYTSHVPEGLTSLDLDTIRLTAQFVARNGKAFLTGLASREHANPSFFFLKPTHSLFAFFTALCDAYSRVLMPPKDLLPRLQKDADDRSVILERALQRMEWERVQEKEAKARAAAAEAEREAMLSVDWHDFVVVEAIEFYDDETDELPPPMTVKDIIRMARAGMKHEEPEPEAAAAAAAEQQAQRMEMDAEEQALVAQGAAAAGGAPAGGDDDMDVSDDEGRGPPAEEEDEGPMRVVKNYQRPNPRQQQSHDPTQFVVSPITGELVPIGEMAEHMRISLIDPKYREQKEAMMAKIRDTTKANDDEIGKNLVSLSRTLPHIFGTTAEEMSALVGKQIAEQRARDAAAARAAIPAPVPQGPAQPLPPPSEPLPEMPAVAAASAPAVPAAAPPSLPAPTLAPPPAAGVPPPTLRPPVAPPASAPLAAPPRPAAPPAAAPPRPAAPPAAAPPAAGPPTSAPPAASPPASAPPAAQQPPRPAPPPGAPPPATAPPPQQPPPARPPMMRPPVPMGVPTTRPPPQFGVPTAPPSGAPPLPPMPYGMPPPLPPREAPPLPEEPDAKRPRTDTFVLTAEEEFADQHPGQQKVYVLCPGVEGSEALRGQLLAVEVPSLMLTVGELKARLSEVLSLAPGKQQLSREHVGVLKNELTLAFYNVGAEVQLQLGIKERGGRKK